MDGEEGSQALLLETSTSPGIQGPTCRVGTPRGQPLHPHAGNSGMMVAWPGDARQWAAAPHRPSCPASLLWWQGPRLRQDSAGPRHCRCVPPAALSPSSQTRDSGLKGFPLRIRKGSFMEPNLSGSQAPASTHLLSQICWNIRLPQTFPGT